MCMPASEHTTSTHLRQSTCAHIAAAQGPVGNTHTHTHEAGGRSRDVGARPCVFSWTCKRLQSAAAGAATLQCEAAMPLLVPFGLTMWLMVPQLLVVRCVAWCCRHLARPRSATLASMPDLASAQVDTSTLRAFCAGSSTQQRRKQRKQASRWGGGPSRGQLCAASTAGY
jgi:hypothetical protein